MTATIVTCEMTIAASAMRVDGRARTARIVSSTRIGRGGPIAPRSLRATSSGSGRRRTAEFSAATANAIAPKIQGPE